MKLESLSGHRTFQDLIFVFGVRKQGLAHKELLGEMSNSTTVNKLDQHVTEWLMIYHI